MAILRRFAALCGGEECRVAIIPTASMLSRRPAVAMRIFFAVWAYARRKLRIASRRTAERREWLDVLDRVDGVFLTGGTSSG